MFFKVKYLNIYLKFFIIPLIFIFITYYYLAQKKPYF